MKKAQPSNKSNKWNTNHSLSQVTNHYWSLVLILGLGEDWKFWLCLWNVFFALVLSVESGKLGCIEWRWLEGIYSPNHNSSHWLCSLSTGTPDSPVRTVHGTVQCSVPAMSVAHWSWPLDSPALVAQRTVWWHNGQSGATWHCDCFWLKCFISSII
jgi:hypothetical protein